MSDLQDLKIVDNKELLNDQGVALALIKIKKYDVILWGAGIIGYSVLRQLLDVYDITPLCIVDNDDNKRGMMIRNVQVIHPSEIKEYVKNASNTYAFIAVGAYVEDEKERCEINRVLESVGIYRRQYMPIWPYAVREFDDYLISHQKETDWVHSILADEESKMALHEYIRCCLQADSYLLPEHKYRFKYFGCDFDGNDDLYTHLENEVFVNLGSNMGDTILQYLAKGYAYDRIYAYEGDEKIFKRLEANMKLLDKEIQDKIELHNEYVGTGDTGRGFDEQFGEKRITLINADIEGAELGVLKGMKRIIKEQAPVIAFCVYHRPDDIVSLPKFILDVNSSYRIYFRKYVLGLRSRYELVMYAVPEARCMRKC